MTGWVDEGRVVEADYLNFSKTFDIVSPEHPHRQTQEVLDEWTLIWIEDWWNDRDRESSWTVIASGVPQGLVPGPASCNLFINDLDEEADASSASSLTLQNHEEQPIPRALCCHL